MQKKPATNHRLFGLIGYPLSHSFSKKYFSQKFQKEHISNCSYELFPLSHIQDLPDLLKRHQELVGLNVTIPYKEQVLDFLDEIADEALAIGAVNTIKIKEGRLYGFNTDVYGFEHSLKTFIQESGLEKPKSALVLGTGGAAKAVHFVLKQMAIKSYSVSRQASKGDFSYSQLDKKRIGEHRLIINTTPLGMAPNIDTCPLFSYESLSNEHLLYDLVYNPEKTVFLKRGLRQGAYIINGLSMLHLQAERAWEIWNEEEV